MNSPCNSAEKERIVARYLRRRVKETGGSIYVKSKFIAEDLELSTREIGACMHRLQENTQELVIEPWSYTKATTWRVALE